jgi:hypothetical protein
MLISDEKSATVRTAEHYRQYRQQLAKKGVTKKPHAISIKNNIKGIKLRWKKYDVSMVYNKSTVMALGSQSPWGYLKNKINLRLK